MNIYYLIIALFIIYIFIVRNNSATTLKKSIYIELSETEFLINNSKFYEIESFLNKKYFDSKFLFYFLEKEEEKFSLYINRNYSIFFLYSENKDKINIRFFTFFTDGNLIITGNRNFELKNIKKLSILKEEIYINSEIEELLKIHFNRLNSFVKNGKTPIYGKSYLFLKYMGYIIKLSDNLAIKDKKN